MLANILKPFLWSYNWNKIDRDKNKKRIILNVLNFGSLQAVQDLFKTYSRDEVLSVFKSAKRTEFSNKNWQFWNIQLNK
jgi:hypothetical protein